MKTANLATLRSGMETLSTGELRSVSLKLARFRTENKELLTYLLFYADDESGFIRDVKEELDQLFSLINTDHLYFARKSIRKITRITNKYIRFSGNNRTEVELRLHLCRLLQHPGLPLTPGTSLGKLYSGQLQKIGKAIAGLHEDLQYDYRSELDSLELR